MQIPNIFLFACKTEKLLLELNIVHRIRIFYIKLCWWYRMIFAFLREKGHFFFLLSLLFKMHQGFLIKADQLLMAVGLPG